MHVTLVLEHPRTRFFPPGPVTLCVPRPGLVGMRRLWLVNEYCMPPPPHSAEIAPQSRFPLADFVSAVEFFCAELPSIQSEVRRSPFGRVSPFPVG